jgi:hypothetical protein
VKLQEEENSNSAQRDEQQIPHGTEQKQTRQACLFMAQGTHNESSRCSRAILANANAGCVSIPARYSACEPIQMASQHALRKRTRQGTHRSCHKPLAQSHEAL